MLLAQPLVVTENARLIDRQLIHRCLAGELQAERALYDAHVDRIYRLMHRMAGDGDLAADFTQEASSARSNAWTSSAATRRADALPILKDVLAQRDPCRAELRRQAVYLIAQRRGDDLSDKADFLTFLQLIGRKPQNLGFSPDVRFGQASQREEELG